MTIISTKGGVLVDRNNQPVLVQIGRKFYSLHSEFRIELSLGMKNDLKEVLDSRTIRLLKEDDKDEL